MKYRLIKSAIPALILILILVILRFLEPGIDPPSFYTGHGQAELTDPYNLTYFARNAVLYGTSDPFNFHRWDIFKYSLASASSYVTFSLFDVSRVTANLSAVYLNLAGLLLFILALKKYWNRRKLILTALFLLLNGLLFFYGRLPFLENGLIFLSGLTFFIFARYHDKLWGLLLTGILVSLAALSGKLFGLILLGPVIITLIYRDRKKALVPIALTVTGAFIGAILFLLFTFGKDISLLTSYYREQTTGMYGAPPGFSSIPNFIKMLLTYGGESGLWQYNPIFLLLTALGAVAVLLTVPLRGKFEKEHLPVIFMLAWLFSGIFGLMPFQYRPLRYGLFLYLPMAAIAAYAFDIFQEKKVRLGLDIKYITLPVIFMILWHLFTQVRIYFAPFGKKFESGAAALPVTFILAAIVAGLLFFWLKNNRRTISGRGPLYIFAFLGLVLAIHQGSYIYRGLVHPNKYLTEFGRELGPMLSTEAVISGPYSSTLVIDDSLKSVIYMFGLANIEKDLFTKYHVTHIAADNSNWKRALSDFPILKESFKILEVPVHDIAVDIYRVPGAAAPPTDFEKGAIYLAQRKADSAYVSFKQFNAAHPDHFFGRTHLAFAAMVNGSIEESLAIVNKLLAERPDDAVLHGFCQAYYQQMFNITKDNKYLALSREYGERAREHK
ncbi:membrane hypothetical protein [Candidatus Zixiibacteriota bacterium]|nr:membrane hypothetical protein [candidate division Zixibacteria bacterium]